MSQSKGKVLFLALDTWSHLGGLQRFNQRVVATLADIAADSGNPEPRVHIMRDTQEDLPKDIRATIIGFGPDRIGFIRASLKAARHADTLMLGQINLLPIGWLAKILNPRLNLMIFVHGIEVWDDPIYRKKRFYEPFLLRAIDRVASVSHYTARIMADRFSISPDKFTIFPNAIDGPITIPDTLPEKPVFLCVTRMAQHDHGKNIDKLLRAFALLPRDMNTKLEIIGDGVLRPQLESLSEALGISGLVRFCGRVSDSELEDAYRRASAFVLPSSKEGFGIVYLEAWKHGLPVICSDQGASHEIIDNGVDGYVINPANITALADAMQKLAKNPRQAALMGQKGAQKVSAAYLAGSFHKNLKQLLGANQ